MPAASCWATTTWQVTSWADTQITATVASGSVSGVVHVFQNDQWSNALTFKVPGGSVTLVPNMINMVVGDTHTIQALNSSGQSVTGLTWTSSNTNIVSLSTDDPPILTAVAAGHATITAGEASADITVSAAVNLPLGTVLWSNPGDGSGVGQIIPAVPSPTGVADVFAIQNDGTVAAITSDGTTAWTADMSNAVGNGWIIPDFQGGLLSFDASAQTITKLDGITGQAYPAFTPSSGTLLDSGNYSHAMVAHPDGTVFALQFNSNGAESMIGIDPISGTQKFSVPLPHSASPAQGFGGGIYQNSLADPNNSLIIAGDGYAYLAYAYGDALPYPSPAAWHLGVFRVNSAGQSDDIRIRDWSIPNYLWPTFNVSMISNADTGVVVSWAQGTLGAPEARPGHLTAKDASDTSSYGLAITNGTSVSTTVNAGMPPNGFLVPALQLQDGSFAGTLEEGTGGTSNGQVTMVAFDASGNVRWTVPNEQPYAATIDGGVMGMSGFGYDQTGSITGQTYLATYSWPGYAYQIGSVEQVVANELYYALGFWPFLGAGQSRNSAARFPTDSLTNDKVKDLMTPALWGKFKNSHCGTVMANMNGMTAMIPNYSLQVAQQKQRMTNYYELDIGDDANLTVNEVTGGQFGSNVTLANYLRAYGPSAAATVNLGYSKQTAIVLPASFFVHKNNWQKPEFDLMHEILFHAYAGLPDDAIFQKCLFPSTGAMARVRFVSHSHYLYMVKYGLSMHSRRTDARSAGANPSIK